MGKETIVKKLSPDDVADFFLSLANESGGVITNLKLQKLVYYAQAWYLANFHKPLFNEDFQAWVHGPVIPKLYEKYKRFGCGQIVKELDPDEVKTRFDAETIEFLTEVANVYMPYDGYALELMTHQETPWTVARGDIESDAKCHTSIDMKLMEKYYGEKIQSSATA